MSDLNTGGPKTWNIYSSSNLNPNGPSPSQTNVKEGQWKSFGTSMSAISFGFVATAILISMFLIMAIFEHLFRPTAAPVSSHDHDDRHHSRHHDHGMESRHAQKLRNPEIVQTSHAPDFSVVMPGHQCPTFIARPAPLPCRREGAYWPSHEHSAAHP